MSGIFDQEVIATWVAAIATVAVFGRLLGERRVFTLAQHLLAGLLTGYLAVLAINEALLPRLVEPLLEDAVARPELWPIVPLVAAVIGVRWLPRPVAAVPVSLLVAGIAAFALGGAVVGTFVPQLAAAAVGPGEPATVLGGLVALTATILVLSVFIHGTPRGRLLGGAAAAGRWVLVGGLGAWLGYLLVTRLVLLLDRIDFVLFDWAGLGR